MINTENAKLYCTDYTQIENYKQALESTERYDCHHRLETDEGKTQKELIEGDLYYNRPASELIFLRQSEHISLHCKGRVGTMLGKHHNDETKKKMSKSALGKHKSETHKKHISEGRKGIVFTEQHCTNISLANKGKEGNRKGAVLSQDTKDKISESLKGKMCGEHNPAYGKHWFTNGEINILTYECPNGFVKGMTKIKFFKE